MSLGRHLLVLAALVVNLWIGGDLIEVWAGHIARAAFEATLIFGYLVLVLRFGGPIGRPRR
jgi:hypothetical protein